MSDTEKRDAVCQEFGAWHRGGIPEEVHWGSAEAMADEIVRLRAENAALTAAVERVRAACENDLRWVDAQPILRALEETP